MNVMVAHVRAQQTGPQEDPENAQNPEATETMTRAKVHARRHATAIDCVYASMTVQERPLYSTMVCAGITGHSVMMPVNADQHAAATRHHRKTKAMGCGSGAAAQVHFAMTFHY